jgi:hypothetical protein
MLQILCRTCLKSFYAKPSWLKRGFGIYCSRKCSDVGRRKGSLVKCTVCSKQIYKSLRDLNRSKSKNYFCSHVCNLNWLNPQQREAGHGNWKNGEFAYKNILLRKGGVPSCLLCAKDNTKILVAHHVDWNRKNNAISNLTWLCYNCHFLVHHYPESNRGLLLKI